MENQNKENKSENENQESKMIRLHNRLNVKTDIHPKCMSCEMQLKFPYECEDVNKYMTYPDVVKANRVLPISDGKRQWVDDDLMFFCDPCYHKISLTIRMGCLQKLESDAVKKQQEIDKQKMSEMLHRRCDEIEAIANGELKCDEEGYPDIEVEKNRIQDPK